MVLFPAGRFISNSATTDYQVSPDDQRFLFKRLIGAQDMTLASMTAVPVQHGLTELDDGVTSGR